MGWVSARGGRRYTYFMGDNGEVHRSRWQKVCETVEGATTDLKPQGLMDLVGSEFHDAYRQFGVAYPEQQLELQLLYGDSQRAFEEKTRESLKTTLHHVLSNVLRDQRLGDPQPDKYLAAYLEREILRIRVRIDQDGELAVNRGLNIGFIAGVFLLFVPLVAGEKLLGLCDVSLNCTDRWSLLGAFVCGGAGAFGAVLSVLTRLRNSGDGLTRRPANGGERLSCPASGPGACGAVVSTGSSSAGCLRSPSTCCSTPVLSPRSRFPLLPLTSVLRIPRRAAPFSGDSGAPWVSWRASTNGGPTDWSDVRSRHDSHVARACPADRH